MGRIAVGEAEARMWVGWDRARFGPTMTTASSTHIGSPRPAHNLDRRADLQSDSARKLAEATPERPDYSGPADRWLRAVIASPSASSRSSVRSCGNPLVIGLN